MRLYNIYQFIYQHVQLPYRVKTILTTAMLTNKGLPKENSLRQLFALHKIQQQPGYKEIYNTGTIKKPITDDTKIIPTETR